MAVNSSIPQLFGFVIGAFCLLFAILLTIFVCYVYLTHQLLLLLIYHDVYQPQSVRAENSHEHSYIIER